MDDIRVIKEQKRLETILERANATEQTKEILSSVIENLAWQRIKLMDTMEEIKTSSVAIKYDNGGGQTGIRENPLFRGYGTLWKAYMTGMDKFTSYLPKDIQEEIRSENTMLDKVRSMKA